MQEKYAWRRPAYPAPGGRHSTSYYLDPWRRKARCHRTNSERHSEVHMVRDLNNALGITALGAGIPHHP